MNNFGDMFFSLDNNKGFGEIVVTDRDVKADLGLESAIFISLFTDRRAEDTDTILSNNIDKKGWWADNTLGSKFWLLKRETNLKDLIAKAEQYSKEALQWLIDTGIAETINVIITVDKKTSTIQLKIEIVQKKGKPLYYAYYYNWLSQIAKKNTL